MIVKLLLLCIMRLTNGINIVSWSSHYDAACGDRCDADELLDGVLSYDHGWNAYNPAQGANQGTAWVIFDFELDVVLSQFDFIGSGDTTHDVADFKLYYGDSTDENGAWTELLSGRGAAGDSQWQTFTVDSNPGAQYYKWSIFNRHSNWQGWIYEVNFEYAYCDETMLDEDCPNGDSDCPQPCMRCCKGRGVCEWDPDFKPDITRAKAISWSFNGFNDVSIPNKPAPINNDPNMYYYILLVGVIAFILINNIFIGCWCLKDKQVSYGKVDMVAGDEV